MHSLARFPRCYHIPCRAIKRPANIKQPIFSISRLNSSLSKIIEPFPVNRPHQQPVLNNNTISIPLSFMSVTPELIEVSEFIDECSNLWINFFECQMLLDNASLESRTIEMFSKSSEIIDKLLRSIPVTIDKFKQMNILLKITLSKILPKVSSQSLNLAQGLSYLLTIPSAKTAFFLNYKLFSRFYTVLIQSLTKVLIESTTTSNKYNTDQLQNLQNNFDKICDDICDYEILKNSVCYKLNKQFIEAIVKVENLPIKVKTSNVEEKIYKLLNRDEWNAYTIAFSSFIFFSKASNRNYDQLLETLVLSAIEHEKCNYSEIANYLKAIFNRTVNSNDKKDVDEVHSDSENSAGMKAEDNVKMTVDDNATQDIPPIVLKLFDKLIELGSTSSLETADDLANAFDVPPPEGKPKSYIRDMIRSSKLSKHLDKGLHEIILARTKTDLERRVIFQEILKKKHYDMARKIQTSYPHLIADFGLISDEQILSQKISESETYLSLPSHILESIVLVDNWDKLEIAANIFGIDVFNAPDSNSNGLNKELKIQHIVGLDSEWTTGRSHASKWSGTSIIQLATCNRVIIFDMITLSRFSGPLKNSLTLQLATKQFFSQLFRREDILKISWQWNASDISIISQTYNNFYGPAFSSWNTLISLDKVAKLFFPELKRGFTVSLSGFSECLLGRPLNKMPRLSDWRTRPLSLNQLHYAALDSFVTVQLLSAAIKANKLPDPGLSNRDSIYELEKCIKYIQTNEEIVKQLDDLHLMSTVSTIP